MSKDKMLFSNTKNNAIVVPTKEKKCTLIVNWVNPPPPHPNNRFYHGSSLGWKYPSL